MHRHLPCLQMFISCVIRGSIFLISGLSISRLPRDGSVHPKVIFLPKCINRGICACDGCRQNDLKVHNRQALLREIALVTLFIEGSRLRDLVESRCRLDAAQVAIMRHLDNRYSFMERCMPVARSGIMRANSGESLRRAEVRRFAERVITRYIPPQARCGSPPSLFGKKTLFPFPESPQVPAGNCRPGPRTYRHLPAGACATGTRVRLPGRSLRCTGHRVLGRRGMRRSLPAFLPGYFESSSRTAGSLHTSMAVH